jgi:predicted GNAT family N-acyltransferase
VVEFGLVGKTMHQVDERVEVAHIQAAEGDLRAHPAGLLRMTRIEVTRDIATCRALRRTVFIEEQGVSEADEVDDLDDEAIHLLAFGKRVPVGTARLLLMGKVGKIGRVCVLPEARGTGLGAALIRAALEELRGSRGSAGLSGRKVHAVGFYEKLGFAVEGEEFIDADVPHRHMRRPLWPI